MITRTRRLLKCNKLCEPSEFRNVFSSNHRSIDSRFVVLAKRNDLSYSRLGLAISKKTVKSAVSRNRIKRIIKESFRLSEIVINGYDLVVMAQKKLESTNGKLMRKSLELHWRKIQTCEKP